MTDQGATRILFVCLGNLCRSPAAEGVMRGLAPDLEVESAGTGPWHVGEAPHAEMVAAAEKAGYDLSALRGRQIGAGDFDRFDLIVAMDAQNATNVERLRPKGNATPVVKLMDYAPEAGVSDVPDPYYSGGFEHVLSMVEAGCRGLLADIRHT